MSISDTIIFGNEQEYRSHLANTNYWWPHISYVLNQNNLNNNFDKGDIKCGYNPTYPVFIIDNLVIKFFGHRSNWQDAFTTESRAHALLSGDQTILVPRIIAKGRLCEGSYPWSYIIYQKVKGRSWLDSDLMFMDKCGIAKSIGEQLYKVHNLNIDGQIFKCPDWNKLDLKHAIGKSVLPDYFKEQVEEFVSDLGNGKSLANGDIVPTHIFVDENNALSGIIDWGDATLADKHYELGKLMDSFDWDKRLLKVMLDAYNWPWNKDFPRRALSMSIYRQAVGLTQHSSFDVFHKLPEIIPLEDIVTLDELSAALFEF